MSRKPHTDSKVTRKKIVNAALKEFSRHDYDHASLRLICGSAGVTTGALYFFFENKEELFKTVLEPLMDAIKQQMIDYPLSSKVTVSKDLDGAADTDEEIARRIIKLCMTYKAQAQIIHNNPDHPVVRDFIDNVIMAVTDQILEVMGKTRDDKRALNFATWLASIRHQSVADVLERGLPEEEAADYLCDVSRLVRCGLPAFLPK